MARRHLALELAIAGIVVGELLAQREGLASRLHLRVGSAEACLRGGDPLVGERQIMPQPGIVRLIADEVPQYLAGTLACSEHGKDIAGSRVLGQRSRDQSRCIGAPLIGRQERLARTRADLALLAIAQDRELELRSV